jgi:homoserine trans-succinylase
LPKRHLVRSILATAAVEGYLQHNNYKFWKETQKVLNFSVNLLKAVKVTLKTVYYSKYAVKFKDPISKETLQLPTSDSEDLIL